MCAYMTDLCGEKQKKTGRPTQLATSRGAARVLTSKLLPFCHILKPFRGETSIIPGGAAHPLIFFPGVHSL